MPPTATGHPESAPEGDLAACDREPIHRPGRIQPHGMLLVLDESGLSVSRSSANVGGPAWS